MKKTPVVSMENGNLIATMVVEESTSTPASPFAAAASTKKSVYSWNGSDLKTNYIPAMMCRPNSTSKETILEELKKITDGISESKAQAIHDSVLSSFAIIDTDNTMDYTPTAEDIKEVTNIFEAMTEQLDKMKNGGASKAGDKLDKYAFKKHLLIQGEKGGGKTYMISKMIADSPDEIGSVDIRGNEGIEAIDLLGYYIKTSSGDLVWKDGPLTQAFRMASKGNKTILFIDEMLRIPKRELNILVGCLSPNSDGNFILDTNQADSIEVSADGKAIATVEKLVVPKDMLWCVGTTNAGAGYAVDTIDEALGDRFRTIIKKVGEKEMKIILSIVAKEHGFPNTVVNKLMKFYKGFNTLKDSGELSKLINLRHLTEILEFSDDMSQVQDVAMDLIPTWCSQDQHGYPNETQSSIIEGLIEKELVA